MPVSPEMASILNGGSYGGGGTLDEAKRDQDIWGKNKAKMDTAVKLGITPSELDQLNAPLDDQTEAAIEAAGRTPGQTPTQSKSFGDQAGQFVKESIGPAAGAYGGAKAGAALGTMVSPGLGTAIGGIGGGILGGMGGEFLTQKAGIKPESTEDILTTGATEAAFPIAGRAAKASYGLAKKVLRHVPGMPIALKQPAITRMRSLPGKFGPETPSSQLYDELEASGDVFIPVRHSRDTLVKLSKKQPGLDPSLRDTKIMRDAKAVDTVYPITGKRFSETRNVLRELNEDIGAAKAKGGTRLHNLTQRRQALLDDMEAAAENMPLLKQANKNFKQESAVNELKSMVAGTLKTIEGAPSVKGKRSPVDFDARGMLDQFRKITNPRNPLDYDQLFVEGLGRKNITEITEALEKLSDIGKVRMGLSGGGSLVAQGAIAGAVGAAGGALVGDEGGALTGGLLGAASPAILSRVLLNRSARAFLLRTLKESKGTVTNPDALMAALGAIVQRTPTLLGE